MEKTEQILQATADIIAEHGLANSPISLIAQAAGVGAGTIYRYFDTKETLIEGLFILLGERLSDYCLQDYDATQDVQTRLNAIWGNFYRFMCDHPRDQRLFDQLWASPAVCSSIREQSMSRIHAQTSELFAQAKMEGKIKELPNDLLGVFTFGSLFTLAKKKSQAEECLALEPLTEEDLLHMCWDAIARH